MVQPKSNLASSLLRAHGASIVPGPSLGGGVEVLQSAERKPLMVEESPESVRRNRSCKVHVEGIVCSRRKPSDDSGYCTAYSTVPHSASTPRFPGSNEGLWEAREVREPVDSSPRGTNMHSSPEIELDSWLARSPAEQRALRRRSSAPSLGGRFRIFLEDEEIANDESD